MRRFGVSLPKDLADFVDRISQQLGVTRSQVVSDALQSYLAHTRTHGGDGHVCFGVTLAVSRDKNMDDILEQYKDIIINYNHIHMDNKCLVILVIKGDGSEVARLNMEIAQRSETHRYVPLE